MASIQEFNVRANLLPFATRVLFRGARERHQPQEWPVPVGTRDLYTAEDLDAWRAILAQGVLYAFTHQAEGWRRRPTLLGKEAWSAQAREARLWGASAGLSLRFGPEALALCEGLYNGVARRPRDASGKPVRKAGHEVASEVARLMDLRLEHLGEVALSYWMLTGLWGQLESAGVRSTDAREKERLGWPRALEHFGARNPLLSLRYGPWLSDPLGEHDLRALINAPARGLLPWWLAHALDHWQRREATTWTLGHEAFIAVRQRQRQLVLAWLDAIDHTGWVHLLLPFQEFFDTQERWLMALTAERNPAAVSADAWRRVAPGAERDPTRMAEAGLQRLDMAYRQLRNVEREALRAAWGGMLNTSGALADVARKRVRLHHAEREANDTFLVDWASDVGLENQAARLNTITRAIEGRLG